jgi:RNA polymerase-binding transcription factor DksA
MNVQVKSKLEATRASIIERRQRIARHTEHREAPLPQDFAEQAVELENEETMVALEQELDLELKKVEQALRRLHEGTYDTCADCDNAINPERLVALPSTSLCIHCAETDRVGGTLTLS